MEGQRPWGRDELCVLWKRGGCGVMGLRMVGPTVRILDFIVRSQGSQDCIFIRGMSDQVCVFKTCTESRLLEVRSIGSWRVDSKKANSFIGFCIGLVVIRPKCRTHWDIHSFIHSFFNTSLLSVF